MLYIRLNDANEITGITETENFDASLIPIGINCIVASSEKHNDMLHSIFIGGIKGDDDIYTSIDYIPRPVGDQFQQWSNVSGIWEDTMTDDKRMTSIRQVRNAELSGSDWTQMPDCPMPVEKKESWAQWRTSLRDLPVNFPNSVECKQELDSLIANKPV